MNTYNKKQLIEREKYNKKYRIIVENYLYYRNKENKFNPLLNELFITKWTIEELERTEKDYLIELIDNFANIKEKIEKLIDYKI